MKQKQGDSQTVTAWRAAETRRVFSLLGMLLGLCLLGGCGKPDPSWHIETRLLYYNIPVTVTFSPDDPALAERVWAYLQSVDEIFNDYRPQTEVSHINAMADRQGVVVSADFAEAVRLSQMVNGLTEGAFDITVGPLRKLWQEAEKRDALPSQPELEAALSHCGMSKIRLQENRIFVDEPQLKFHFGGIIKGVAVDRAMALLQAGGAKAAMIQVGGETGAFGLSRRHKNHVIGILDPLDKQGVWTAVRDQGKGISVATSANYHQPVEIAGKTYYHILDPKTGMPVDVHLLSASVVFPELGRNGLADGLSTACAVLGPERARAIIASMGGEALFVMRENEEVVTYKTKGWDRLVPEP